MSSIGFACPFRAPVTAKIRPATARFMRNAAQPVFDFEARLSISRSSERWFPSCEKCIRDASKFLIRWWNGEAPSIQEERGCAPNTLTLKECQPRIDASEPI